MATNPFPATQRDDAELEDVESPGSTSRLQAVLLGWLIASGFGLARFVDVSAEGKLISLLVFAMAAAGTWMIFTRPSLTTVILIAYLPFSLAYPYPLFGLPGLNGSNLVLILGIAAWVACSLGREGRAFGVLEFMVVAYLTLGAIGAVGGQLRMGGIDVADLLTDYRWWAAPILLFFVARATIEDEDDAQALLATLAYVTFVIGALTWLEGIEFRDRRSIEDQRVAGVLGQPNTMGAFLAYYGVPLLALAVAKGRWLPRTLCLVAFLVVARSIIFTFSRGALLALLAGSAAVVGMVNPVGVGVVGAAGLLARSNPQLLPTSVRDRFAQTADEDVEIYDESLESQLDKSSAERLNLWRGGLAMMRARPFLGVGLKAFQGAVFSYAPEPVDPGGPRDAHNAYILTGAELGLPALLLMVAILLGIGFAAFGSWRRAEGPGERRLALACLGCLAAVMVSCVFGSRFSEDALIGGFWLLGGTLCALRRGDAEDDDDEEDLEVDPDD